MFIKKTTNAQGQTYYHIVESYRTRDHRGKSVSRHRTLMSLGRCKDKDKTLKSLANLLEKHSKLLTASKITNK